MYKFEFVKKDSPFRKTICIDSSKLVDAIIEFKRRGYNPDEWTYIKVSEYNG